jgi:hypothetical protein
LIGIVEKVMARSPLDDVAISPSSPNPFSRESGEGEKTNYSTLYTLSQFVGEGAPMESGRVREMHDSLAAMLIAGFSTLPF